MKRVAMKSIVVVLVWLLPLFFQNFSFDPARGTGQTISAGVTNSGNALGQQIDIDDDHRHVFVSLLSYFAANSTAVSSIPVERLTDRSEARLRADNRPIYQRISVLLI